MGIAGKFGQGIVVSRTNLRPCHCGESQSPDPEISWYSVNWGVLYRNIVLEIATALPGLAMTGEWRRNYEHSNNFSFSLLQFATGAL